MPVILYQPIIFGDSDGAMGAHARLAAQNISLPGDVLTRTLVGDAFTLLGHSVGGGDTLDSVALDATTVIGDAIAVTDHALGGNDTLSALGRGAATVLGDAVTLGGWAQGGNDSIGVNAVNGTAAAYGDAETITDHARG